MRHRPVTLAALTLTIAGLATAPGQAIVGGAALPHDAVRGAARIDLPDDVCSGSLIGARRVLTALHCLQTPQDGVSPSDLGRDATVTIGNPNDRGRVQVRHVAQVYVAPQGYAPTGITHTADAAILVLDRPSAAPPTPLAPPAEVAPLTAGGAALLVAGFGASVSAPPAPDGGEPVLAASKILKGAALTAGACPSATADLLLHAACAVPAAGDPSSGNSCAGDSGAPVLAPSPSHGGARAQVGVLSGAVQAGACGQSSTTVFTTLDAPLAAWIGAVLASPLPTTAKAPHACVAMRHSLARAKRHAARLARAGHGHRLALRAARRLAQAQTTRIYRQC